MLSRLIRTGAVAALVSAAFAADYAVYIGTYTNDKSKGIYRLTFDSATGQLGTPTVAAETVNPSFLAVHPSRKYLFAVSEIANFDGQKTGAVSAFRIDPESGALSLLNKVDSKGMGPCHVSVDKAGKNVLVANYGGGTVAVLPIAEDGRLKEANSFVQHTGSGADPKRQRGPHAHSINVSADNKFAVAADLGLDKLLVYKFDAGAGKIEPHSPPFFHVAPGSGPRHFAFHPNGRYGYAINELLSTVTALSWDSGRGVFTEVQTARTLPEGFSGENYTAEVVVHPSGKFVYGSNRGHDSIAVFAVDPKNGSLTPVDHTPTQGRTPRNFGIDPTGKFLIAANQRSDNLVVFRIDAKTGKLSPTRQTIDVGSPVCVRFMSLK
jgi:6-phosphogluconolactonase